MNLDGSVPVEGFEQTSYTTYLSIGVLTEAAPNRGDWKGIVVAANGAGHLEFHVRYKQTVTGSVMYWKRISVWQSVIAKTPFVLFCEGRVLAPCCNFSDSVDEFSRE